MICPSRASVTRRCSGTAASSFCVAVATSASNGTARNVRRLLLGIISLRTLRAVPFEADVATATQKLLAAVPEHLRVTLARLGQIIGAEMPPADIFHAEPDEPAA